MVPASRDTDGELAASIFRAVFRRRWLVVLLGAAGMIGGVVWLLVRQPTYRTDAMVAVASDAEGGLRGLMSGQVGALASLAGIDVGGNDVKKNEYLARLKSHALVRDFIQKNDLLRVLFSKRWDAAAQRWKHTLIHPHDPNLYDGTDYFLNEVLTISEDRKSGLVTVRIEWSDPETAAAWANGLVELANEQLRAAAVLENTRRTEFLEKELQRNSEVETRQVMSRLYEQHLNRIMIAKTQPEYAFRVVDRALAPDPLRPLSPRIGPSLSIGLFMGLSIGVLLALWLGRKEIAAPYLLDDVRPSSGGDI